MAKAEETGRRREAAQQHNNITMQVKEFPRDFLPRFMNGRHFAHRINQEQQIEETEEEIELSLGLSLNGRFGVDPTRAKRLTRSSSIPEFVNPFAAACDNNDTSFMVPMSCANLIRTCSLPIETEEDSRKRKELQTLRRMEAKRKRSEKQRNMKIAKDRNRDSGEENIVEDEKREESVSGVNQLENCVPFGVQSWINGGKVTGGIVLKGGAAAVEGGLVSASSVVAASQGSNGSSRGTGSSGFSELESQPAQGTFVDEVALQSGEKQLAQVYQASHPERNKALTKELCKGSEAISPSSVKSISKNEHKLPSIPEVATMEKSGKSVAMGNESSKSSGAEKGVKEVVRNVLEDMPCVSATGDGPNGKRIDGFLYRYRKGEEVRIVCVCHGNFLTPAEFVKHAGGGDVAHPLKHIVVNQYPLL